MIFEPLMESANRGELILIDGGFCHWHLRRNGQITIREIIVLPERQRQGIGRSMLDILRTKGGKSLYAKCPIDLSANEWYQHLGFYLEDIETTKSGRELKCWRLYLEH